MKPHYFDQEAPDADDLQLAAAIHQGYVPTGCLLGGPVVMGEVGKGLDPCAGCHCPRVKCGGRPLRLQPHDDWTFEPFRDRRQARGDVRERQIDGAFAILGRMNRR